VRWVSRWTNDILRVRARDGTVYALRLCRPGWRTREDLLLEVAWLQALQREPSLNTPRVVPSRDGALFVETDGTGGVEPRRCLLTNWSTGIRLGLRLTSPNLHEMGRLFARLHEHGHRFEPPPEVPIKVMDDIHARGEEDIRLGALRRAKMAPRVVGLFTHTAERVREVFARRFGDPSGLRVIHNDLHHDNINVCRGQLFPFDFEDTVWGYPVQDIATAQQDLMDDATPAAFEQLLGAFRAGYEDHSPWPERHPGEVDLFRAAFVLRRTNREAHRGEAALRRRAEEVVPMLEALLDTGKLRKR